MDKSTRTYNKQAMNWDSFVTWLIRPIAGSSHYAPENFWKNASAEARALAEKALAPFAHSMAPVDYHAHLVGNGVGLNPPALHKDMLSWRHPLSHIRYLSYLSALKLPLSRKNPDRHIRQHIHHLVKHIRDPSKVPSRSYRVQMLAVDSYYTTDGQKKEDSTHFYVSNDYLLELVREFPENFTPVFSVHPFRRDAIEELTRCHTLFEEWKSHLVTRGIIKSEDSSKIPKMLKWLPNSMGIDPMNPLCDRFYDKLREFQFTLLSHAGEELAVTVDRYHQRLGNPLHLRRPIRFGVNVIVAHCASLGKNPDFDHDGRLEDNLTLCLRMLKESIENPKEGDGKLYGDISALGIFMCQKQLCTILDTPEIHHRLFNGSDYPIPAINILVHLWGAKRAGMITAKEATSLREIYNYNPLLMDVVFKRTVRHPQSGRQFPEELFTHVPDSYPSREDQNHLRQQKLA